MQKTPKVSVIIPSLDGYRDGNVDKLLSDLGEQTFKDLEVKVVEGIKPNGKARNVGSKDAKGEILVFIDDDIRLGHNKILENLIGFLESDNKMAMVGASVRLPEESRYFQKEYDKIRNFSSTARETLDYQGKVSHACLAIKKSIFQEMKGEREDLITGTDIDLNMRIKAGGYRVAVVPNTWVYHLMPNSILKLIKEAFTCGFGSAYAVKMVPEVFGLPKIKFTNYTIKTSPGALIYRTITTLVRLPIYVLTFRPVHFLFYFFHTVGYTLGWIRFKSSTEAE